jgi:hypothetical protein
MRDGGVTVAHCGATSEKSVGLRVRVKSTYDGVALIANPSTKPLKEPLNILIGRSLTTIG